MGPSKEGYNPLAGFTDDELRGLWDLADRTPGESAEGFPKGIIALEIDSRNHVVRIKARSERPQQVPSRWRRFTFNPIDGSGFMEDQNRAGRLLARMRR